MKLLDCIDKNKVVQMNEQMIKAVPSFDKRFQYLCMNEEHCEHKHKPKNWVYCTGNKEYEI